MNRIEDVTNYITECDKEVGEALALELGRQRRNLELIASENIVSPAVMLAMGTVPTNKYAEGYPGKRYYGGCQCVDVVENLARERAKELALQGDGHPNENWSEMVGKIDREIATCQAQKVQYYEAYRNGDLDRGAFVEQKAALAIRIEHLQGERTEIELKRQAQRTQIEARESAKRELSQYLYATHLDGALLTESMYQAIDRVKVFSNERIEIRWKFEDLFAGQGYRERKAV